MVYGLWNTVNPDIVRIETTFEEGVMKEFLTDFVSDNVSTGSVTGRYLL